jgi:hypothetical protein
MNKTSLIASILATIGIVAALVLAGKYGASQKDLESARAETGAALDALVEAKRVHAEELLAVQDQAAANLQTAEARWKDATKKLEEQHAERLTAANVQFSDLLENGRRSLTYISTLEEKLKGNQSLDAGELERLAAIASGLDHLRAQYRKPMQEFTELGAYFERQANASITEPETKRFKGIKRLFSKNFREQERELNREYEQRLGQRAAFEVAHARFSAAYGAAQKQMDALGRDMADHSQRLYALIDEGKAAHSEDLARFFAESKKAINVHLEMIELDPGDFDDPPEPALRP